jgi:hypothetical protein
MVAVSSNRSSGGYTDPYHAANHRSAHHPYRENLSVRESWEFLGTLGLNISAGILLREGARAIIKVVPVWGNAVSGMVAGAGTYAVGRAAIAYFIEDIPLSESKKLFQRLLPGWDAFKRRRLPDLTRGEKNSSRPEE